MALIVEDGSGVADAESLASVAFADDYHAKRGNAAWGPLLEEVKEQLLRKATDYATSTYYGAWNGSQISATQSLPFPRKVAGVNIGNPLAIQKAIAELALIARTTPLQPNVTRGKKRVKIGPMEVEYDGNSSVATKFVSASNLFAAFLTGFASGAMVKLVRS